MIEFEENGYLPLGIHLIEWEEFDEQFNYNSTRQRLIDGLELDSRTNIRKGIIAIDLTTWAPL
ncbi:hypothetical protein RIVM261_062090 [Rivularia sp. IAM M-261]|nr:hypothetical protein RIVM261_062090 [Rivularia sp. IAM M-261]